MDKPLFADHFRRAHEAALSFAREMVVQHLPEARLFLIYPNQSYDGHPLVSDEEVYPEETLPEDEHLAPLTESETIDWLWRNGKVPEWIDVSVQRCDKKVSFIQLLCCGRYTANDELLYHQQAGRPPFHVTSPPLPPRWKSVEENGRFNLHRHLKKWGQKWKWWP